MPDDLYFGLQAKAAFFIYGVLDKLYKGKHIRCGGAARVNKKAGVLAGYLRSAHAYALEAGGIYKGGGKGALRALENAACRRIVKRLELSAAAGKIRHTRRYILRVVGPEGKHGAYDRNIASA